MTDKGKTDFQTVIGLEVHVQLSTKTKAFCSCAVSFGEAPNTNVCPVCLGQPGSLPVLNRKAFEYAIKMALAFNCEVQKLVKFDRKNYYYPDLPKNYQISQYDMPLAYRGFVAIKDDDAQEKHIGINRIHMEEDAGKLIHDESVPYSFVDLNRAGTPLMEIVTEPEISSPDDAYKYLTVLKRTIAYLGVSNCNMEEGSLRCDANISLKERSAAKLGTKTEIKNLNSFKAVKEALEYEIRRQRKILQSGGEVHSETLSWDEKMNVTKTMRSKEEAHDYRYFPEPDLVPFEMSVELIKDIADEMPELPTERVSRFEEEYKLDIKDIEILTSEREIADFFEKAVEFYPNAKSIANWVRGEIMKHMNERSCRITDLAISPENFAQIVKMVDKSLISGLSGKEVLLESLKTDESPLEIVDRKSLRQVSKEDDLMDIVNEIIEENPRPVNDFKDGKGNALSFLIGQVMKKSKGKANPKVAGELFRKRLG